jgi:hypothetical protein
MDRPSEESVDSARIGASRRKFTAEEDLQLRSLVEQLGIKHWDEISRCLQDRTPRQCRNRYKNYLLDSLVTNPWTPEEDAVLIEKFHQIGPKWVEIGKLLSGRSGNNVKNRWYKHLCKTDIGAKPTREAWLPEGKAPINLAQAIGWNDSDWPKFFGSPESTPHAEWSAGASAGDPLF